MKYYEREGAEFRFASPEAKICTFGLLLVVAATLIMFVTRIGSSSLTDESILDNALSKFYAAIALWSGRCLLAGFSLAALGAMLLFLMPTDRIIYYMVRRQLCCSTYGNPLSLKDGERLPRISVDNSNGAYTITVFATATTVETIAAAASSVSSGLSGRLKNFAIVETNIDEAFNKVTFRIADVMADKSLYFQDAEEMRQSDHTKLAVQQDAFIDLTTSGSMLFAGKTRSGKTTGVISLLLQILINGPDCYGSEVLIIDPKKAELSRLPHVVTLDSDGEAVAILDAIRAFANSIVERQSVLNDLSEAAGDAVKWWDADMHVSVMFLDEFVALRSLFPAKPPKGYPDYYCLSTFDSLLKRIVTMGASAGCYAIISIAEASVESGGLPAMLRSAMSTRVLFRPTLPEARLLWDSGMLENMPQRTYGPGDAWFSSTDGVHDMVSSVHFPVMDFPVYRTLACLLNEYYALRGAVRNLDVRGGWKT